MDSPLVSVIVPIFNVEKYVRKCLDSLKNQTMKQIEVICIDDGSTDESGRIAEEYKDEEGWPRFRIIHTENRGLSAARNRGIDEARADWLMFVDSDDWVEKKFCEIPYEMAVENNADMMIFGGVEEKIFRNNRILDNYAPIGIVDECVTYKYGRGFAWNKLYKKGLFKFIRYPEGRVYEDGSTTHKIVHIAKTIFMIHDCFYHYVYRRNSISHTLTESNIQDRFISYYEEYTNLISWGYVDERRKDLLVTYALNYLSISDDSNNEIYRNAIKVINSIDTVPKNQKFKYKSAMVIWIFNPNLFIKFCRFKGRKRKKYV